MLAAIAVDHTFDKRKGEVESMTWTYYSFSLLPCIPETKQELKRKVTEKKANNDAIHELDGYMTSGRNELERICNILGGFGRIWAAVR